MSFWGELKRRNVFKVGAAYAIVAWLLVQIANTFFPILHLPEWTVTLVACLLILGFPVALIHAWAYEVTPDGIKKTKEVTLAESITHMTGKKLDYILGGLLLIAVGYILFDNLYLDKRTAAPEIDATVYEQTPAAADVEDTQKSIAVIPFVNFSSDPEQEYFVDGLTEEILNSLAQIPELTVIARTSSFTFKGSEKKIQEIAGELGVSHILEGSVRKADNALRITAQLVKGVDGSHLWSETYDRKLEDIFAVQEDIATSVAGELKIKLGIDNSLRISGGTDSEKAYELYLIANGKILNSEFDKAFESINEALAIDPEFALAWISKAFVYNAMSLLVSTEEVESAYNLQLQAVQKAIELGPKLPEAYASLGDYYATTGDWFSAEMNYQKAVTLSSESKLNPTVYANYLFAIGYMERANKFLERAVKIDPFNEITRTTYIFSFGILGNLQQAEEEFDRMRELYGDTGIFGDMTILIVRLICGEDVMGDEIISDLLSRPVPTPNGTNIWKMIIADIDSPKKCLAELHRLYDTSENADSGMLVNLSTLAAYFGDTYLAIDAMEKALERNASIGRTIWSPIYHDVRKLPRFKEFVRGVGLVDYWNEFGWPDLCRPTDDGDFVCD